MARYDKRTDVEKIESKFPWIKEADIENAWITENKEKLVWENGTWKDGTWEDGTWEKGFWWDGTWENGIWKDGTWEYGIWLGGTWEKGFWWDGTWEDGIWKDGTWEKGDFHVKFNGNDIIFKKPIIGVDKIIKELGSRLTKENFELILKRYIKIRNAFTSNTK